VKRLHRLLLIWLLMLALPLQGYAGTHMLMCSPGAGPHIMTTAAAPALTPPCHAHAGPAHTADAAHAAAGHHDTGKHGATGHGACAACAFVAAMAPGALPRLAVHTPASTAIAFRSPSLPTADPSLPDRPPRHVRA
jgi:hypothetical protein